MIVFGFLKTEKPKQCTNCFGFCLRYALKGERSYDQFHKVIHFPQKARIDMRLHCV